MTALKVSGSCQIMPSWSGSRELSSEDLKSLYPAAEAEEKNEELFTTGDVGVGVSTAEEPVLVTNMENSSLAYLLRSTIYQTQNEAIRTEAKTREDAHLHVEAIICAQVRDG
jgi:hypothetical protein